jgi:type IV secretory pathway protease TraF
MMGRRKPTLALAAIALLGGISVCVRPAPRLLWNATTSAPVGLYGLEPIGTPRVGDLVAVRATGWLAEWLAVRGYLPPGVLLVKRIAAASASEVCRRGADVLIDGRIAAVAEAKDRFGRPLPVWTGCVVLTASQVLLLNPAPGSLDGRYFGATPGNDIVAEAHLIWRGS